jgi:pilus assembly protein CpaB
MRPKSMILIVIAMGCGLIASIGISQVLERRNVSGEGKVEAGEIYVALVDVPITERLSAKTIKLEEWPIDKIPEGAVTKFEDIDGRRPIQPLYAGEPILYRKLIDSDTPFGASERIPKGMRVTSVKVTMDSAASGLILPGDRVDILVYLRRLGGVNSPSTKTILTDVTVFAVNEQINRETDGDGSVIHAKTVSLLVRPDQVERLMLASELGKLRLSLRRNDDDTEVVTLGADVASLNNTEKVRDSSSATQSKSSAANQNNTESSLLRMLDAMQEQEPELATPSTSLAVLDIRTMEIHTPEGISKYTWDDTSKLPREIRGDESEKPTLEIPTDSGSLLDDEGIKDRNGSEADQDATAEVSDGNSVGNAHGFPVDGDSTANDTGSNESLSDEKL